MTFADDEPVAVSKAEIERALRVAQEQEQVLRKLEREIARNKDYLQKVRVGSDCKAKTEGCFRQCEAGRKARIRLRTGLILKKTFWQVRRRGIVGLRNTYIEIQETDDPNLLMSFGHHVRVNCAGTVIAESCPPLVSAEREQDDAKSRSII